MSVEYYGIKWGQDGFGTSGGVVTYSFASAQSTATYGFDAQLSVTYQAAVAAAFEVWSSYADIDFVYVADANAADIALGWDAIDGAGGTLAEAFCGYDHTGTITQAEIRFDTSEIWAVSGVGGAHSFAAVALHEIGHALGLDHATSTDSIMYPYYGHLGLTPADIAAIQVLYGPEDSVGWSNGLALDVGGWNYGWHTSGWSAYGWHYETGWELGWYDSGSGWTFGGYYFSGWELGWYNSGAWSLGWYHDSGGWGAGWSLGTNNAGGWSGTEYGQTSAASAWSFGWTLDYGSWDFGWYGLGSWLYGWHTESGWDVGWWNGSAAWYYHSGWEQGWYTAGWWGWAQGLHYDSGGWGVGWNLA